MMRSLKMLTYIRLYSYSKYNRKPIIKLLAYLKRKEKKYYFNVVFILFPILKKIIEIECCFHKPRGYDV